MDSDGLSSDDDVDPDDDDEDFVVDDDDDDDDGDDDDDAYAELVGDAVDGAPRRRRAPRTDRTDRPLVPFGFVGKRLGVAPPPSVAPIVGPEDVEADDLADVLRLLAICRAKASSAQTRGGLSYVEKCRAKAAAENRVAVLTDFNLTEEGVRDGGRAGKGKRRPGVGGRPANRDASGEPLVDKETREKNRLTGVVQCATDTILGLEMPARIEKFKNVSELIEYKLSEDQLEMLAALCERVKRNALNRRAPAKGHAESLELAEAIAKSMDMRPAEVLYAYAPKRKAAAAPVAPTPKAQKVPKPPKAKAAPKMMKRALETLEADGAFLKTDEDWKQFRLRNFLFFRDFTVEDLKKKYEEME